MITCGNCSTENPTGAAFCMACGTALTRRCASCGADLPAGAAFCMSCGAPAGAAPAAADPPAPDAEGGLRRFIPSELLDKLEFAAESGGMAGERRTVTMLFCDVTGSTAAARKLDPEEWADIMNGAFEHLIAPVYRYEGTLARLMGDAILAFFGAPIGHEDDPERAVLAGLEILRDIESYKAEVLRDWGIDFDVRVGVNTGLVVVGAVGSDLRVEYTAMGDAVNLAARMEQTAEPGTIRITEATKTLIEQLFEFEDLGGIDVKGHAEPVRSFRVIRPRERPETLRGVEGFEAPLIGRDEEIGRLQADLTALHERGQGGIIAVSGEAGIGKSRLVAEARSSTGRDIAWFEGRSLSYETAAPYAPVRRILRSLVGLRGDESAPEAWRKLEDSVATAAPGMVPAIAPFLGWMLDIDLPDDAAQRTRYLQPPQLRAEAFRAIGSLIEKQAQQRPMVIAFDDLHWADPGSLELIPLLFEIAVRAPLSVLLLFRPRHDDPSWGIHESAGREYPHLYTHIALSPLTAADTRDLVGHLLAVDGLDDHHRSIILDRSEGNPFFVEEIIRSMVDGGVVVHTGDRWVATAAQADFTVPENLSAVLTTRLDQLDERCRRVAQAASVIGRQFRYDELAAAAPDVSQLDDALVELQRRNLIREVTRIPKRLFRFKHALVREAAYETVLLKSRVQLHATMANFLEELQPERVGDIADHLVRARQGERAVPYLVAAGEDATRTYALPVAIARLEQALEAMTDETPADLMRRALEALGQTREYLFDFPGASEAYGRLRAEGERRGDRAMQISGMNKNGLIRGFFFDERQAALDDLLAAETLAREADEGEGLVEACMSQCYLRTGYAEFDEVEHYMNEVTAIGTELGMLEPTLFGMAHFANTLAYLTRFDEALIAGQKTLAKAEAEGHLHYQAEMLTFVIPTCHFRNGDIEAAMAAIERGMEIAQRIGDRGSEAFAAVFQGKVAMSRGYLEEALALFRRAKAAADATGIPYMRALGLCVTGTCYQTIGGAMIDRALEYHRQTLDTMELPTGTTLGAWLWSEIGHCALAAGEVGDAKALFHKALTEKTAPMYLMRPSALMGDVEVALAEGRIAAARDSWAELEAYVTSRQMRDHYLSLPFIAARIEAADGQHDLALRHLDACEEMASKFEMQRVLLDIHAAQARSLDALNRPDDATAIRERAGAVVGAIAAGMQDARLRESFVGHAAGLIAAAP